MSLILNTKFADIPTLYTKQNLEDDLAAGVGSVAAGVGADYRLFVDTANAYVTISHKDTKYNGVASPGSVKPGIGISSTGIAMGYNRASDGQWVNSVAITAAGNAVFSGTVNAYGGSIVGALTVGGELLIGSTGSIHTDGKASYSSTTNGIWIGYDGGQYKLNIGGASSSLKWDGSQLYINGTAAGTVVSGAAAGASAVQPAQIAGMLTSSSSYILGGVVTVSNVGCGIKTGDLAWNSSGIVTSGSGVAITDKGIIGAWQGSTTFSINGTTGAAVFKGDITGASGSFSGNLITTGQVVASGSSSTTVGSASLSGAVVAVSNGTGEEAIDAYLTGSSSSASAIRGWSSSSNANSAGVFGLGPIGVHGQGTGLAGVVASKNSATYGLYVDGPMAITSTTLVSNLNADYLDGYHASSFVRYTGNNLPQTATINGRTAQWAEIVVNGVTYYLLAS